jgi:hypothetical protein
MHTSTLTLGELHTERLRLLNILRTAEKVSELESQDLESVNIVLETLVLAIEHRDSVRGLLPSLYRACVGLHNTTLAHISEQTNTRLSA